jgi:hypothetical protein
VSIGYSDTVSAGYSIIPEPTRLLDSQLESTSLEDEGITVLQNINGHSPSDTVPYPSRLESSKEDILRRIMLIFYSIHVSIIPVERTMLALVPPCELEVLDYYSWLHLPSWDQ